MIKLTKMHNKVIKTVVTVLSLITLSVGTVTSVQPVAAKSTHVRKSVKKSKTKYEYVYKYNRKKKTFIRCRVKVQKKQRKPKQTIENEYPAQGTIPNAHHVDEFTDDDLATYYLSGKCWTKKTITYNDDDLADYQRDYVEGAIKQINDLHLVTLVKTNQSANITLKVDDKEHSRILGTTYTVVSGQQYKNLSVIKSATIVFKANNLEMYSRYPLVWNQTTIHEIGHALGLTHSDQDTHKIMSPLVYAYAIPTNDNDHTIIDQSYINSLTMLYDN